MENELKLQPLSNEKPSSYAERLSDLYSKSGSTKNKKIKGQFFTPIEIACFMATLYNSSKSFIKILDPGSGTCILSCALIEDIVTKNNSIKEIELDMFETDTEIINYTKLVIKYLQGWLIDNNIKLKYSINTNDFVLENTDCFQANPNIFNLSKHDLYDVVITNPPYFKISKIDKRAVSAKSIIYGQPNIYFIFLMIAAKLLKKDGDLIAIIPRSFSSGNYFREFRNAFFQEVVIEKIHLFGSRKEAFNKEKVLQETLIIKAKKQVGNGKSPKIYLSHSNGIKDLNLIKEKKHKLYDLIDLNSIEKILHLPANKTEKKVIKIFKSWTGNLKEYDIKISTGPVVTFRATDFLSDVKLIGNDEFVPLYQLHNTSSMSFDWPIFKKGKAQYIKVNEHSKFLLIPNKNYIFLRRFSSKDDKSRLIASAYFRQNYPFEYIGVENHLNYIYRQNGNLETNELLGLAALLNSRLFDTYFRTFNGNINVSATEIREIPLPPLEDVKQIGLQILINNNFSKSIINEIVNSYFDLENLLITNEKN